MYNLYLKELKELIKNKSDKELNERFSEFLKNDEVVFNDGLFFPAWCVKNKYNEVIDLLFKAGCDFSKYYCFADYSRKNYKKDKISILSYAKSCGDDEFFNYFKKKFKTQRKHIGEFFEACLNGELNKVEELIKLGTPIDCTNDEFTTPLIVACQYGRTEIVKLLIENGANVNARDFMGATPLMWASYSNNFEILKMLVDNGANVNAKDKVNGSTPLIWWSTNSINNVKAIEYLVKHGALTSTKVSYKKKKFNSHVPEGTGVNNLDWSAKDHANSANNDEISDYLAKLK